MSYPPLHDGDMKNDEKFGKNGVLLQSLPEEKRVEILEFLESHPLSDLRELLAREGICVAVDALQEFRIVERGQLAKSERDNQSQEVSDAAPPRPGNRPLRQIPCRHSNGNARRPRLNPLLKKRMRIPQIFIRVGNSEPKAPANCRSLPLRADKNEAV